jgi:hypothetical protein
MSADLELVAKRAASWSETADQLKTQLDLVRWIVFALTIVGALAAALASQIPPEAGAAQARSQVAHCIRDAWRGPAGGRHLSVQSAVARRGAGMGESGAAARRLSAKPSGPLRRPNPRIDLSTADELPGRGT